MERLTFEVHDGGLFVKETDVKTYEVEDEVMHTGNAIRKLAEYEDLEEQGRLLKLPCAVGDRIYYPNKFGNRVLDFEIVQIQIFKDEMVFFDDSENEYHTEDFGKIVYLTREQAESKLNEMEGING